MKTLAWGTVNNRRGLTSLAVIAGLGALYMYTKNGGKISMLAGRAFDALKGARQQLGEWAPSVTDTSVSKV